MRNFDRAAADEFADHSIARDDIRVLDLRLLESGSRFQQTLHTFVTDAGVEKAGVGVEVRRALAAVPYRRRKMGWSAGRSKGNRH